MMPRKTKSTLVHHRFPAFYACYLLKSIRTPRSTATYIGSTPSPLRRIRQHNGEITQGAWKTKHNRPWVMQMIVHGFPSKLAALQFEWAWQHPHISRHLRDDDGKAVFNRSRKTNYMGANVRIARSMVSSHPYNTWPLHVKIFTKEAVKAWQDAPSDLDKLSLPPGLTCATELEGVDGKSGCVGSGRIGPIDVTDSQFTSDHLRKMSALLASRDRLKCSICHIILESHPPDPLTTALCPSSGCSAISHLTCLSQHFLSTSTSQAEIIPRGGQCKSCHSYTLWGDVIRGCDRRSGGAIPDPESEADEEDGEFAPEEDGMLLPTGPALGPSGHRKFAKKTARRVRCVARDSEEEGEFFDLDAVSSTSEDEDDADKPPSHLSPKNTRTAKSSATGSQARSRAAGGVKTTMASPTASKRHHHTSTTLRFDIDSQDVSTPSAENGRFAETPSDSGQSESEGAISWEQLQSSAWVPHRVPSAGSSTFHATTGASRLPTHPPYSIYQDLPISPTGHSHLSWNRNDRSNLASATDVAVSEDHEALPGPLQRISRATEHEHRNRATLAPFPTLPPLAQRHHMPVLPARSKREFVLTDSSDAESSNSSAPAKTNGRRHLQESPASTSCNRDVVTYLERTDDGSARLSRAMSTLSVSSWSDKSSLENKSSDTHEGRHSGAYAFKGDVFERGPRNKNIIILSD